MLNLIAALDIPNGNGLSAIIYSLLRWVYTFVGNYGLAVILFTLLLRLILLPLDFLNKYLTKNNNAKMAVFKDEDNELKKQYASNPMAYMTARKELYRRNGYKPGFSSLFMLANMILTLWIFITVYSCLGQISTLNLNRQYEKLGDVYIRYEQSATLDIDSDAFRVEINETYAQYNSSFIWVHNIFRSDTWTSKTPTASEFKNSIKNMELPASIAPEDKTAYLDTMYKSIFDSDAGALSSTNKSGWNGYFILVVLAAVTTYFSSIVNMNAMKKKKQTESQKEIEVGYSIRKANESASDPAIPQIDPAMMGNMMKYILPVVMIIATYSSTAAFALYIAAGSIIQTSLGLGVNFLTDKIIARKEKIKKDAEPKHPVINPHSRYFKKEYK